MVPNPSISQTLLKYIDELWIFIVPLLIMYLARGFIADLISWIIIRWSNKDYYSEGGEIWWDNHWQIIFTIKFTHIAIFYTEPETNKRIVTTVSNTKYVKANHTFRAKF